VNRGYAGPRGAEQVGLAQNLVLLVAGKRAAYGVAAVATAYSLRAPTQVDEYQPLMLEILTTSPVCGEWMKLPPPM